jgi:hypothetical protein
MSVLDTEDVPVNAPEPVVPAGRRRLLSSWAATVTVTAVSTYALDGVATAAGVLLVASGALGGLGHWHALVFLAATYAAWGMGLRANLRANWTLLEQTGMSTNALSKAAHDLTRRTRPRPPDRLGGRLSGPRVGQGGSLLRRRVRRGRAQRLGLLHRRHCFPRRHEPRRRRRRVRARPPHPVRPPVALPAGVRALRH